jgi:signal transduction histidine kinase
MHSEFFRLAPGIFPSNGWWKVSSLTKKQIGTLALMVLGILAVIAAENWDARNEARAAITDLMREHELLATALATKPVRAEVTSPVGAPTAMAVKTLCAAAETFEREGAVIVLYDDAKLRSCRGAEFVVPILENAMRVGQRGVTLSREDAPRLGLPARIAVAGIASTSLPKGWPGVAVVGSAASERDRSQRQQARAVISIAVVTALILGFGVVGLRQQKRALALEQAVELERTRQERDAVLAKANRMATVAALASGFAHEIGTPLGVISGRIEQLRGVNGAPDRRSDLLAKVALQVERIDKVIRSFLGFARGDAPMLVELPANKVAENAALLVRHRFAAARVELRADLDPSETLTISCEPALFEQALVNVLTNALEASKASQIVTLRLVRSDGAMIFSVLDEGSGISASAMERATEPFFTTKRRSGGSGLGLTIAKEIVAHHRGELLIRRRNEGATDGSPGTEVTIRVPLTHSGAPT